MLKKIILSLLIMTLVFFVVGCGSSNSSNSNSSSDTNLKEVPKTEKIINDISSKKIDKGSYKVIDTRLKTVSNEYYTGQLLVCSFIDNNDNS